MRFIGTVQFRSSLGTNTGPPGESKIQQLNPNRRTSILKVTGWPELAIGSLNLEVEGEVVSALNKFDPVWVEDCSSVAYPEPYEQIPIKRGFYNYYSATAIKAELRQAVLVRRAGNPVPNRVELFAPVSLKELFGLNAGQQLLVTVHGHNDSLWNVLREWLMGWVNRCAASRRLN